MHHFSYVGGVLHAEDVSLARIAEEVGTPFYCYSTATLERHYRVLQRGLRRPRHADLLCHQGQLQPGRDRHAGAARRRHGRGLGRRAAPRARRGRAGRQDHLRRRRQDARGDGLCAGRGHPRLQRGVRARAGGPERGGGGPRPHRAHRLARQPGRRCQDARQDLHRQGREQVRRAVRRRTAALRQGGRAARHRGRRHPHAHRQPDHRPAAVPQCLRPDARAGGEPARRRPRYRASRHGRRPRRALPRRQRRAALAAGLRRRGARDAWAISGSRSCWSPGA